MEQLDQKIEQLEVHRLRGGRLSLPDALAQSFAVMAPAMSGAFITYIAAIRAGGATPLAYVLATLACLFIGGVVGEFALTLPTAGSLYTYTVKGLGSGAGFLTGWIYTFGFLLAGPAVLAGFSAWMSLFLKSLIGVNIHFAWIFGAGMLLMFVLSYFDIRLSTRVQLGLLVLTVAFIVALALIIVGKGGASGNTIKAFSPGAAGVPFSGIMFGLAFGILSFTGFETAAVLGEETRKPRRNIPIAVIGSVVIGGLFYTLVTYSTSIGYGVRNATTAWPADTAPLLTMAHRFASGLGDLILLAASLSAFICALGIHNTVSRIWYSMGREGILPSFLGRTHRVHKTPHLAIFLNLGLWIALPIIAVNLAAGSTTKALGGSAFYIFTELLTLATPPIMLGYVLVTLAGLRFSTVGNKFRARHTLVSVFGLAAAAAAVYGSLYYSFSPAGKVPTYLAVVPWIDGAWLVLGLAAAAAIRAVRQDSWGRMGLVFEVED
jgi:amino acid transporter